MDFPTLVYRCPGPHVGPPGTTYAAEPAADEAALAAALSAGWFKTLPEAVEAFLAPKTEAASETVDESPPTRAELEERAAELGVKVDKRWGDKRLMQEIVAALEAKGD